MSFDFLQISVQIYSSPESKKNNRLRRINNNNGNYKASVKKD